MTTVKSIRVGVGLQKPNILHYSLLARTYKFQNSDPELLVHVQPRLRSLHHRADDQVLQHVSLPLLRHIQDRT